MSCLYEIYCAVFSAPILALLDQIRNGEMLVVTKLDRLGRDAQDVSATIKLLTGRKIKAIVLPLGRLHRASAAGKLILSMLAAVAEMDDLLVERPLAGLARAKAEGKTLGSIIHAAIVRFSHWLDNFARLHPLLAWLLQ
jgi:DNA invertase Pin-like site-specific DNA recombinase